MHTAQVNGGDEQMKNNLLDSMAPKYPNPMASIKASVSALLADSRLEASLRKDLLVVIAEKANLLNSLVGEALDDWDAEVRRQALQKSNRRASDFRLAKTRADGRTRGCQSRSQSWPISAAALGKRSKLSA